MEKEVKEVLTEALTEKDPYITVRVPARDWRRNANGGDYDFYYHFTLRPDGLVEVEFGTSAEFDYYCPKRGVFVRCEDCSEWNSEERYCAAPPLVISRDKALEMIDRLYKEIDRRRAES